MTDRRKLKVAIIFSGFGNPGQPFLTEWFERISKSQHIEIKGFTDRSFVSHSGVVNFHSSVVTKFFRYISWRMKSAFNRALRNIHFTQLPLFNFQPDVVHILNAQKWHYYKPFLEAWPCKWMVSFRGFETSVRPLEDEEWGKELLQIYEKANALHFVSTFLMNEAVQRGAVPTKCVVLRRSVNTDFFCPNTKLKPAADPVRLLAVGRLTWQKGYDILLEAMVSLKREGTRFELLIVGKGPDEEKVKKQIADFKLADEVKVVSFLDRKALREHLQQYDIFVQASRSDALPNSVLEASACGMPIVSTMAGGIPEAVVKGETAVLVEPGNAQAFYQALSVLIQVKDEQKRMGEQGKKFMDREFSHHHEIERWVRCYQQVDDSHITEIKTTKAV